MNKYVFLILVMLSGWSCRQPNKENTVTIAEEQYTQKEVIIKDDVELSVDSNVFQLSALPDMVKVKMENYTNDTITTGLYYHIEYDNEGQWVDILPDQFFNDLGYSIRSGDATEFDIRLLSDQVDYKVGRYRIAKYYLKSDFLETRERQYVYVEFIIE